MVAIASSCARASHALYENTLRPRNSSSSKTEGLGTLSWLPLEKPLPATHCARHGGGPRPYSPRLSRRLPSAQTPPKIARLDFPETSLHGRFGSLHEAGRTQPHEPLCSQWKQTPNVQPVAVSISIRLCGGQAAFSSHQRRQISGDFHAHANFGDDRGIPAHEFNSLSLPPRWPLVVTWSSSAPLPRGVTCFERSLTVAGPFKVWACPAAPRPVMRDGCRGGAVIGRFSPR